MFEAAPLQHRLHRHLPLHHLFDGDLGATLLLREQVRQLADEVAEVPAASARARRLQRGPRLLRGIPAKERVT